MPISALQDRGKRGYGIEKVDTPQDDGHEEFYGFDRHNECSPIVIAGGPKTEDAKLCQSLPHSIFTNMLWTLGIAIPLTFFNFLEGVCAPPWYETTGDGAEVGNWWNYFGSRVLHLPIYLLGWVGL